jgi:hypothetical protein
MLTPFLTAEKQAIVFGPRDCGEIVSGKFFVGRMSAFVVAIGGKADVACCGANVCF